MQYFFYLSLERQNCSNDFKMSKFASCHNLLVCQRAQRIHKIYIEHKDSVTFFESWIKHLFKQTCALTVKLRYYSIVASNRASNIFFIFIYIKTNCKSLERDIHSFCNRPLIKSTNSKGTKSFT